MLFLILFVSWGLVGPAYSTFFTGVSLPNGNVFSSFLVPFLSVVLMYQRWIYDKKAWNGTGEHLHERKSRHGASITRVSRRWNRHPNNFRRRFHSSVGTVAFTRGSAVCKNVPCRIDVLARVNGASILSPCRLMKTFSCHVLEQSKSCALFKSCYKVGTV